MEVSPNIKYDAFITGFFNDSNDILNTREMIGDAKLDNPRVLALVDPIFADDGIKYEGVTEKHIDNYRKLLEISDIMTPNLTEACMLANVSYETYREKYCTINYENSNKEKTNDISKKIIESREGRKYTALVTSNYHVYRALRYCRKTGLQCTGIGSRVAFYYWPSALIREYIAVHVEKKHAVIMAAGWVATMVLLMLYIYKF